MQITMAYLFIFKSNVRVLAEARLGADSQEPLVGHYMCCIDAMSSGRVA